MVPEARTAQLAAAMRVQQEFGPERQRSRSVRLSERHPEIPADVRGALFETCDRIEEEAYVLGQRILAYEITTADAARALAESYPGLPADIVERAVGQGTYFAAR